MKKVKNCGKTINFCGKTINLYTKVWKNDQILWNNDQFIHRSVEKRSVLGFQKFYFLALYRILFPGRTILRIVSTL